MKNNNGKVFTKLFWYSVFNSEISYKSTSARGKKIYKRFLLFYSVLVLSIISISTLTLLFNNKIRVEYNYYFIIIEIITFLFLIFDFSARWWVYEQKHKKKWKAILFPITLSGIFSILSIMPSLYIANIWTETSNKVLRDFEALKFFRIFRVMLLTNAIPGIFILKRAITKEKKSLMVVASLILFTLLICSLIIFNFERNNSKIKNYFDALYFTAMTITSVGFGDIVPISYTGKIIVILMSLIGVGVVAISSGIIAGSFIEELKELKKKKRKKEAITKKNLDKLQIEKEKDK